MAQPIRKRAARGARAWPASLAAQGRTTLAIDVGAQAKVVAPRVTAHALWSAGVSRVDGSVFARALVDGVAHLSAVGMLMVARVACSNCGKIPTLCMHARALARKLFSARRMRRCARPKYGAMRRSGRRVDVPNGRARA